MIALSGALLTNTTLTELNLRCKGKRIHITNNVHQKVMFVNCIIDNEIGAAGAESLGEALKTCKLVKLDLSGMHRVSNCFPRTLHLIHVQTTENGFGDSGTVALARALTENTTLCELHLESEYIIRCTCDFKRKLHI